MSASRTHNLDLSAPPIIKVVQQRSLIIGLVFAAISAISKGGYLLFNLFDGGKRFKGADIIKWLRQMLAYHPRRHLAVVMDRAPCHMSKAVKNFVAYSLQRLRAMIEIWTKDEAAFHGKYVDFDPIYCWPKPVSKPHTPLYIGGGPANFSRITELGAGWLSISPSADALAPDLAKLRDLAGPDVPVIASHIGDVTAEVLAGYRDLGIEHVTVELPTQPRDETLRHLDALHAEYAKLA